MKAVTMTGTGGREMLEYVERPDPYARSWRGTG